MYAILERAQVENIPKVVAHGTVKFPGDSEGIPQSTQTDKFHGKHGLKGHVLQGLVHYRIVVDTVGRDLTGFRSSREVLQVFIDILTGISVLLPSRSLLKLFVVSARTGVFEGRNPSS